MSNTFQKFPLVSDGLSEMNYANYINHVDMNRLYIVANPTVKSNKPETQPPKLCPTSMGEHSNNGSKADLDFSERVKQAFPTVEIIPSNKFKCCCGHIGALNGQR